ncbi:MAG: valine--tRNA ligase [Myxococcales bacterium]|nr:valine--tRNA ligase [Myxococcales bacterium]
MAPSDFTRPYDPREVEPKWREKTLASSWFHAVDGVSPAFTLAIPPPNVTGSLHMGHALTITIEDAIIRHARMRGLNTLYIPGIDHAGIATQVVVERQLKLEGKTRHDLGRDAFIERVWQWKGESGGRIFEQQKVLGTSLDWARAKFTMDADMSRAVREAFVRLYEEGLIYRANRLVNWSIGAQSVISDLEVVREEPDPAKPNAELFSFAYALEDGSGEIVVATTRPETMVGDTAIAVHPDDARYQHLVGRFVTHPFVKRRIPIIADGVLADPTKGTGAVKVTPAHDFNDYEAGRRNGLEMINILNLDGTLNAEGGPFAGMERFAAREAVKKALEAAGLARGSQPHAIAYARCQRTDSILEPLLLPQWYVKMQPLAEPALAAVKDGRITFTPEEWTKTYDHWMSNIQDWCISRQLWWGHQIPAWYCDACEAVTVSRDDVTACSGCGSAKVRRDEDVLDTWFSSALWPFATLGWPEETPALKTFYPTSVMETGFDIIFFWVARMIMMGMHFLGEVPFKRVLLHGMVCDETGSKMSKVKGNVIDPLDLVNGATLREIVEHASRGVPYAQAQKNFAAAYPSTSNLKEGFPAYGADAVRFYLASHPPQSKKINLNLSRLQGYRDFCNKIWNATRFALTHIADVGPRPTGPFPRPESVAERWIVSRLAHTVSAVNQAVEDFRLDEATAAVYQFFWYELCDWFLELSKPVFESGSEAARASYKLTLAHCLETSHRLLHPFMPHLTEECWAHLPENIRRRRSDGGLPEVLALAPFPGEGEGHRDVEVEAQMEALQAAIEAVRRTCAELGIKPGANLAVTFRSADRRKVETLEQYSAAVRRLTRARETAVEHVSGEVARPRGVGYAVSHGIEVLIPLAGLIDPGAEGQRLEKDIAKVKKEADAIAKRLDNKDFLARAPADVVEKDRARVAELRDRAERLAAAVAVLGEVGSSQI